MNYQTHFTEQTVNHLPSTRYSSAKIAEQPRKYRIAILDDDASLMYLLNSVLTDGGHVCHTFTQASDLLKALTRESFDILLLDWNLPDMDGMQVLTWVRQNLDVKFPILMLTGRSSETDTVLALNKGADEYMNKPFRREELLARVNALLRRSEVISHQDRNSQQQVIEGYTFEALDHIVQYTTEKGVQKMVLTPKEFALARLFFRNIGTPMSRRHIVDLVWGHGAFLGSRTLETHVSSIRNKLRLNVQGQFRLVPVYGYGYRLEHAGSPVLQNSSNSAEAPVDSVSV